MQLAVKRAHRRLLRSSVRRLLEGLGSGVDDVADRLRADGAHGVARSSGSCVLARYLYAVVGAEPTVTGVTVGQRSLRLTRSGLHPALRVRLPPPVSAFVRAFDQGRYPDLMLERPRPRPAVGAGPVGDGHPGEGRPGDRSVADGSAGGPGSSPG